MGLAFGFVPLHGATLERLSFEDMIAKSTAIVRGKVTGSSGAFRGSIIYTHYSIQILETFKGSASAATDVVVPGGAANSLRQSYLGAPQLQTGDEFVFFLWRGPSGLTQILGLTQGLFKISSDGSTDALATRAASTELMLDRGTGHPVKDQTLTMSLSDLRSRVARQLGGH